MKRKTKRIFSLLLALAVMATMMAALPLTASAATLNDLTKIPAGEDGTKSEFITSELTPASGAITENKYFVRSGTSFETGNKSLTLDGQSISYTGWRVKSGANKGLSGSRVIAFKPGGACNIKVYADNNSGDDRVPTISINGSDEIIGQHINTDTDKYNYVEKAYSAESATKGEPVYVAANGGDGYLYKIVLEWGEVANVPVTGVTVAPDTVNLQMGFSTTLKATVAPANATNLGVTWSSANEEVATVSEDGTVLAKSVGETTVTVKTVDGNYTAEATINVTDADKVSVPNLATNSNDYVEWDFSLENKEESKASKVTFYTDSACSTEGTVADGENYVKQTAQKGDTGATLSIKRNGKPEITYSNGFDNEAAFSTMSGDSYSANGRFGGKASGMFTYTIDPKLNEKYSSAKVYVIYGSNSANAGRYNSSAGDMTLSPPNGVTSNSEVNFAVLTVENITDTFTLNSTVEAYLFYIGIEYIPAPTATFGESATDSGYYTDAPSNTLGVIRFLQEYSGDTPDSYGFYFVNSEGTIIFENATESKIENSEDEIANGGFYGDLTDIPENDENTYYAKPFVKIGGTMLYGDAIDGTVDWEKEVNYPETAVE